MRLRIGLSLLISGVFACSGSENNAEPDPVAPWRPSVVHTDQAYLQEVMTPLGDLTGVLALAEGPSDLFALTADGVFAWADERWTEVEVGLEPPFIDFDVSEDGALGVVGERGLEIDGALIELPAGTSATFIRASSGDAFFVGGLGLAAAVRGGVLTPLFDPGQETIQDLFAVDEAWFAATPEGLMTELGVMTSSAGLPADDVRSLAVASDGTLWVGTSEGLAHRGPGQSTFTPFLGKDGLHYGDINRIRVDEADRLIVSTSMGASVVGSDIAPRYYFGRNWIRDSRVVDALRLSDGSLIFATPAGVSRVEAVSMTLEERAARYDEITQARHVRMGFTSTENHLEVAGDVSTFFNGDDDNDGQWTAMYLASQCFRYAVTQDEAARENARVAAYALIRLESITEIDGFFARSILSADECGNPAERPGEWHLTSDGQWCWKGDTSSDEFVGHIFGLSLFYDLAATEEEKADVRETLSKIVDYLMANGYLLLDADGEVTSYGHFDPDWINNSLPAQLGDAGLNSAMMLGALSAAHHMTGDPKYAEQFDLLATTHNYQDYVSRIEEIGLSFHTNHDSEEMSFLAMFTLMRYETDPDRTELWQKGLDYLWEVQRPERNPEFNMIYGALAQSDEADLETSIETLQKLPLSLIMWGTDHSHRWDAVADRYPDRHGDKQNKFVLPYNERDVMRWADNPYAFATRGNGQQEASGTFWLLPYWMGRYYGFID